MEKPNYADYENAEDFGAAELKYQDWLHAEMEARRVDEFEERTGRCYVGREKLPCTCIDRA